MFSLAHRPLRSCSSYGARSGARPQLQVVRSVTAERASLDLSKMQPLHDRLLIKPYEDELKTAGGILLPAGPPKANSDAHFGEVLAVGEQVQLKVSPGDMVVYNKYAMAEVEVPAGEVVFVAEKSVIGKLE
ncbi:MAG: chaperonin 11 [Monoraphidium minutum]|nr:MAG: chaperonin 11 [Monoraphidium minutum]